MDLATMLNNVLAQSGFLEKGSFTGTSDPDDRQMVAIANKTVSEIRDFYPWSALKSTFQVFPTEGDPGAGGAAGETVRTSYQLPEDFRSLAPNSVWEIDGSRMLEWPVPSSRWYLYKFSSFSSGGIGRIRQYGDEIEVESPGNWQPFEFEYVSKYPVRSAQGARQEYFRNDTDTTVLDDRIMILGIQANWAEVKMFPQAAQWKANYMQKIAEAIGRDTGSKVIGGANSVPEVARGAPYYPLWRPAGGG